MTVPDTNSFPTDMKPASGGDLSGHRDVQWGVVKTRDGKPSEIHMEFTAPNGARVHATIDYHRGNGGSFAGVTISQSEYGDNFFQGANAQGWTDAKPGDTHGITPQAIVDLASQLLTQNGMTPPPITLTGGAAPAADITHRSTQGVIPVPRN